MYPVHDEDDFDQLDDDDYVEVIVLHRERNFHRTRQGQRVA